MPWSTKCTSAAPTVASGRISRGNDTFLTSDAFVTTDVVAPNAPLEKKFHTSTPDNKKMGKRGIDVPRITPKATQYTRSTRSGFRSDQAKPSAEFLYLTLSSLRTIPA